MAGQSDSDPERTRARLGPLVQFLLAHKRLLVKVGVSLLLFGILAAPLVELALASGRVLGGVEVAGVYVGGADTAALSRTLAARATELGRRRIFVVVAGSRFEFGAERFGVRFDVSDTARRALLAGREGSLVTRALGFYRRLWRNQEVEFSAALDAGKLAGVLEELERASIPDPPYAGGIELRGTEVVVKPGKSGRRVDQRAARGKLLDAFMRGTPSVVELPVVTVAAPLPPSAAEAVATKARALLRGPLTLTSSEPAARLELQPNELAACLRSELRAGALELGFDQERFQKLVEPARKAVEAEPVDARFEIDASDRVKIVPSKTGIRLDMAALFGALFSAASASDRRADLPLRHEPLPALTTAEAESLGVKGLVTSFTTRHPCCEKRVDNIHRIADLVNDKLVRPGETVSLNALVGPRTAKNGFVPAPTIEEGEMVDTVGGGVSQFATTLFNALFHGGYEIIERQPHTYWFPRYPMGHEATLSWPKPDVIFRNDTAHGLLIKTVYTGTNITVKLYGDNDGRKVRGEVSGRQNVVEPALEILPNSDMPPDEERVKQPGGVGWSVIVSRVITFRDGTKKEERRRVTYKPKARRIEVHPCRIPRGEKGYTGERCPEPEDVEEAPEESEPEASAR
jgi:vancomycin resistance protein YoaR